MVKPTCIPSSSTSSPTDHQENQSGTWNKYKGVRKRKWGKWVSEIRLPNSRERIWLGSYDSAEKAARAFDAALYCLRGRDAKFNFPENPPEISRGRELNPQEIQKVAARFANEMAEVAKNNDIDDNVDSNLNESHSPNINNAVGIEQSYTSTSSVSVSMSMSVSDGTPAMQQTESEMMNWSSFLRMLDHNPGLSNYDYYPELDHQLYPPPIDTGDDNFVDDENGGQGYTSPSSFLWNF